jgi:hypothetical protein
MTRKPLLFHVLRRRNLLRRRGFNEVDMEHTP